MTTNIKQRAEEAAIECIQGNGRDENEWGRGCFIAGASWALKNLPRCSSCRYWDGTIIEGHCLNKYAPNGDYAASAIRTGQHFGCVLHSELEGEK